MKLALDLARKKFRVLKCWSPASILPTTKNLLRSATTVATKEMFNTSTWNVCVVMFEKVTSEIRGCVVVHDVDI